MGCAAGGSYATTHSDDASIISALLIICLTFSTSATVFAQDTRSTYIPNEQGKSVSYIGEYKLVLWDSGNIVYAEQYNSQGNLIASATANRINGEIITSDAIENSLGKF